MDRFGSSRLRIVWVLSSLLLVGLALGAIQGFGPDGTTLSAFGTTIPLGTDFRPSTAENLGRLVFTLVPAVILLGGILPLGEWLGAASKGERFKALLLGTGIAFLHGIFLSQVAMLPVLAASAKLFGSPFGQAAAQAAAQAAQTLAEGEVAPASPWKILLMADLNALLLGLQLLLWSAALGLVLKSNRGLGILGAYMLAEVNKLLSWVTEVGTDLELPKLVVKATTFLSRLLPMQSLPGDGLTAGILLLGVGGPLVLTALLLLLPGKGPKKTKA